MQYRITIEGSAQAVVSHPGQSALDAMVGQPAALEVGCRGGGCGVCRVEVLSGSFACGDMSAEQISAECHARGIALACRLFPNSDLHLRPLGKRLAAGRSVDLDTAALLRGLSKFARCSERLGPGACS